MTDEETTVDQEEALEGQEQGEQEEEQKELSEEEQLMAKLKEAITVENEEIGSLRAKLTITVPRDMLDERMGEQFAELKREADVPGFRKGRAPLRLIQKRFGSDVGDQLITQLVSSGYMAAIEKEELDPLGDPLIWAKVREQRSTEGGGTRTVETEKLLPLEEATDHLKLPKEGSLTFSCEIDLKPKFELPELTKIPIERPALTVRDDDIDGELNNLRSLWGTFKAVEEGGVKADDLLYADVKMTVDGEAIFHDENVDLPARDTSFKGIRWEGFQEAVVGKAVGDEVTFEVDVPDEYDNIDIRGKRATLSVTLREMKRFEMPPIDEKFLSSLGVESEDELRSSIRARLEEQIESIVRRPMWEQVRKYLMDKADFDLPEGMSQRLVEKSVQRKMMEMYRANTPQVDIDKAVDEMRAEAGERMAHDLKLLFILEKAAEELEIHVGEEEINGAIAAIAQRQNKRFDRVRDELSKGDGLMSLYMQLRDEKVLDRLLKDADVTETEGPKSD